MNGAVYGCSVGANIPCDATVARCLSGRSRPLLHIDIELKIKSLGDLSGRQDRCKVTQIKYSDKLGVWVWRNRKEAG